MVRTDDASETGTVTEGTPGTDTAEVSSGPAGAVVDVIPPLEPLPPARRTGLIVVVAALLLLLVAGVTGAMLLVPAFRSGTVAVDPGAATAKARVEAAIGVMKALRINDLAAVRPYLTDSAQKAITDAQWGEAAAASEVASAAFAPTVWSGATTATVGYELDGATGTMTFAPNPGKPNVVTMTEAGPDGDLVYDVALTAVGTSWRAVALTPRTEPFKLDEAFVKSLLETPAP